MSDIDQRAEAERLLDLAKDTVTEPWDLLDSHDVTVTMLTIAEAHARATIARADQARIANLIAFTDSVHAEVRAGAKPSELVWARLESAGKQIIEGLGL